MQFTLEFSPSVTYVAFQYGDREVKDLWSKLKAKIPEFFQDIPIEPALLHGDLWSGNIGQDSIGPGV